MWINGIRNGVVRRMIATLSVVLLTGCSRDRGFVDDTQAAAKREYKALLRRITVAERNREQCRGLVERRRELLPQVEAAQTKLMTTRNSRDRIGREIAERREELAWLSNWVTPHFVLGNDRSPAVFAMRHLDGRFVVTAEAATIGRVQKATRVARQAHIPCVATAVARDEAKRLTDEIQSGRLSVGMPVLPAMQSRLETSLWRSWRYVDVAPDQPLTLALFRNTVTQAQQVGVFRGTDSDNLLLHAIGNKSLAVARPRVDESNLWIERAEEALPWVEAGPAFLDYCALNVAHKISHAADVRGVHVVAVQVTLDSLVKDFEPATASQLFETYYSASQLGAKRDTSADFANGDFAAIARRLGDDFQSRLVALGIPVAEREHAEQARLEQSYHRAESPRDIARLAAATHLVVVEVDRPMNAGQYRLSIKLIDLASEQVLWSISDEKTAVAATQANPFLVQSGQPIIVTLNPGAAEFHPIEQPARVKLLRQTLDPAKHPLTAIVLKESDDAETLRYRPLFSTRIHKISRSRAAWRPLNNDTEATSVALRDLSVRPHLLRYVTWRVAQKTLTAAGRVLATDGDSATISLGSRHGLSEQSVLRVMRPADVNQQPEHRDPRLREPENHEPAGATASADVDSLLPIRAFVTQIIDPDHARVTLVRSAAVADWQPRSIKLQVNDLVLNRAEPRRRLFVYPVALIAPVSTLLRQELEWSRESSRNIRVREAVEVSRKLQRTLVEGFGDLLPATSGQLIGLDQVLESDRVNYQGTIDEAGRSGATHLLGGELTWVTSRTFDVTLKLREIQRLDNRWTLRDEIETLRFQLGINDW